MAINKLTGPNSTPLTVADYQAQNGLIAALNSNGFGFGLAPFSGSGMTVGAVLQVGGSVYRVDTATAITGTSSDFVKITPSGATATAAFVANLTGVTWNSTYNGYYDVSGNRYLIAYHYGARKKVYGTPGTYTWVSPPYCNGVLFNGVGAGGNGAVNGAGGGSGASLVDTIVAVTPNTSYTIVVSNAGASTAFGISLGKGANAVTTTAGAGGTGSGGASNGFAGGTGGFAGGGGIGGVGGTPANGTSTGGGGGSGGAASAAVGGVAKSASIFNGAGLSGITAGSPPQTMSTGTGGAGAGGNGGIGVGGNGGIGGGGGGGGSSAGIGGTSLIVIEW